MEEDKSNYDIIMEAIEYLESEDQEFVTADWMDEHQNFFITIRGEFPDLSAVNEDIRDMGFRNKAAEAEKYARKVENAKYFDIISYCQMCKLCYDLYQFCQDENELTNAFEKLIVTSK